MSTGRTASQTSIIVFLLSVILIEDILVTHSASEDTLNIDQLIQSSNSLETDIEVAQAADTSRQILLSSDGSYSWQFFPYNNSAQRLLVVLSTSYNTTVVWIANRDHPVSPNASLVLNRSARTLALQDDTVSVWSPAVTNISAIVMNSTGNLYMVAGGTSAWESFDDPTDVFVPGQRLHTNHTSTANLAWNDWSSGRYTLKADPGGAVLYATFDYQQTMVPYQIINFGTTNESLAVSLHSPCNHTTILYNADATGVTLEQEGPTSPQCLQFTAYANSINGISFASRIGGTGYRFMRVMPTGDINSFFLSNSTGLRLDNELFRGFFGTYCKLPAYCGVNSLCSSVQNCSCPDLFQPLDPSDTSLGCRLETPLNCSIFREHKFLQVPGADYYANTYLAPGYVVKSPSDCTDLCLQNCSCTAAFFDNSTGACYMYDQVQTMQYGASPAVTAFLRVAYLPESDTPSPSNVFLSAKVLASISAGVVMMVGLAVWVTVRLMKKNSPNEDSDSEEEAFLEGLPGLPPRFSYQELQDATDGFNRRLGAGGSGAVYEGDLRFPSAADKKPHAHKQEPVKVAVKVLTMSEFSTIAAANKRQFRAEVAVLGNLNHVNLVQLMGFCAEGTHRLLIYEFVENGSLDKWIYSPATVVLPWEVRYQIAVDMARGLAFLHDECRDKVVHLDVKPQNILLDSSFRAKLADFGMSKLMERGHNQTVTAMRGTPGYMAPEWFLNLPITDKSDVFSYGMVLLELVGGRKNLNTAACTSEEWYFPAWALRRAAEGRIGEVVDKRLREQEQLPQEEESEEEEKEDGDEDLVAANSPRMSEIGRIKMERLVSVAFWCIQEDVSTRPSMTTVVLMLDEHLQVPNPPLDMAYVPRVRHPPTKGIVRRGPFSSASDSAAGNAPSVSSSNSGAADIYSVVSAR